MIPKDYIGDGIYIEDMGWCARLTTEDGISVQNEIFIGESELASINRYFKRIEEEKV